jgi:HK97 family phage prohead protease
MIIRTKSGEFKAGNASVLLDYLGVQKEAAGVKTIEKEVELIACVPLQLTEKTETTNGIPWTLSTFDLDRYGERIDPQGWDIKQFLNNPVVEWSHNYLIPAIGKIEGLAFDDNGLHGLVIFNSKEYDHFAWGIEQRVRAGVIRAGSVGFRIKEIEIPSKEDSKDGTTLIFRKQELVEFSVCNVPANPFALAKTIEAAKTETTQDFTRPTFWGGIINNL